MAQGRADGYKVTVTVVDGANILKAFLPDDGASMDGVRNAALAKVTDKLKVGGTRGFSHAFKRG